MAEWTPALAPGSLPLDGGPALYLPVPDMPELCRRLLDGVDATWSFAIDALHPGPKGWQLASGDERHDAHFDTVVLAIPPAQAAPLLGPHRRDWARQAALAAMQPCWTLMGVADAPNPEPGWDLARPASGPLAGVLRSDARPGRARVPGQAHWVVHARAGWSRRRLEQTPEWALRQLPDSVRQFQRPGVVYRPVDGKQAALVPGCETSLVWRAAGVQPTLDRFLEFARHQVRPFSSHG